MMSSKSALPKSRRRFSATRRPAASSPRARAHVQASRPRYRPSAEEAAGLLAAFKQAAESGNPAGLASFLASDAVLMSDGGGKRAAALRPIHGVENIIRLIEGLARKAAPREVRPRSP